MRVDAVGQVLKLGVMALVVNLSASWAGSSEICPKLETRFASETLLRSRQDGTWPAAWAVFFADEIGSPPRNKVWLGCDPQETAEETVACVWRFEFRDAEAEPLFDDLRRVLTDCLRPVATVTHDLGVNHPDRYDAYIIELPSHRMTVAIKDKSALGATFVAFRLYTAQ